MTQDSRLTQLHAWIPQILPLDSFDLSPASADASFRRYFRITADSKSWIAMDAPPEHEDCRPFVHIAQLLEAAGVHAPHIHAYDELQGFMILDDLGSSPYLDQLNDQSVEKLYQDAIDSLVKMQTINDQLPGYDTRLLQFEMSLFNDWYIEKHLQLRLSAGQQKVLQNSIELLTQSALQQPQVFVHRDYHSRNLMITTSDNPGVIDFQDAVTGAISYDLVSLLKDCYIAWPRQRVEHWVSYFIDSNPLTQNISFDTFIRWFDFMGAQRHIKVAGIFARLCHRDGKAGYLDDIPRTLAYLFDACERYDELHELLSLLHELDLQPDTETLSLIR